ncbi:sugar ABC transporter permease [Salinibacterium sp. ZJ454]|uniref:carbohydrate ABC transporter permease n=1 Tax=Salinibacterium sp. ZJ454 TaxID=2708339 RepID=UPI001421D97A|nr:sugar ABC transporter permease [Salinibacterium sp. ZJ454]
MLPLLPSVLLLALFLAGPILWSFYISFTDTALTGRAAKSPSFVGLENYADLLSDPDFPLSLWLTVVFVVASAVIGQNLLGLGIALLQDRVNRVSRAVISTIVVAAWVLPEIVAAFAAYAYFAKDGTLNQLLGAVGISGPNWLFDFPMLAIVLANIWRGTAFSMMVYQAALNDVPPEITEAAVIDGANGIQKLIFVTIPMIRGSIATNLMLITLQTLAVFTLIWVMTQGGPGMASSTLPVLAYQEAFKFQQIGYGAAIAVVMLLIGAVFSVVYIRALRPGRDA